MPRAPTELELLLMKIEDLLPSETNKLVRALAEAVIYLLKIVLGRIGYIELGRGEPIPPKEGSA